ncbi:MAG: flagellar protein FliT [Pseudomonadales bacterium]|nr:flagellar protein FliT [Pseudomonadales bacterium]
MVSKIKSELEIVSPEEFIACYESLLERSARMIKLARAGDWPVLIEEESQYIVESERLGRLETDAELSEGMQVRKATLLEGIFENDLEIRQCLVARRDELNKLLKAQRKTGRKERKMDVAANKEGANEDFDQGSV